MQILDEKFGKQRYLIHGLIRAVTAYGICQYRHHYSAQVLFGKQNEVTHWNNNFRQRVIQHGVR